MYLSNIPIPLELDNIFYNKNSKKILYMQMVTQTLNQYHHSTAAFMKKQVLFIFYWDVNARITKTTQKFASIV